MSQQPPQRPSSQEQIKYGDVFQLFGELADKTITPQDVALMQSFETTLLGQTQKGSLAAVMQSATTQNKRVGVVSHIDVIDIGSREGMTVKVNVPGKRIIIESIGGQVLGGYTQDVPPTDQTRIRNAADNVMTEGDEKATIGEVLEATALAAGDKPVDQGDATTIQAAEVRAMRSNVISPGGVAAMAQSAATANARIARDEDKTKFDDILTDANAKLPATKSVTRQDAEGVVVQGTES